MCAILIYFGFDLFYSERKLHIAQLLDFVKEKESN